MSKFTDELFDLCVKTVDAYSLDKLFLNFGHSENEARFEEYMNEMCDINKLYVMYKYEVYYQGEIVTKEVLKETHDNAAVLPVLLKPINELSETWGTLFKTYEPKRRTDALLDFLTHKYSLVRSDIFSDSFYSYTILLCRTVAKEDVSGRKHFSGFINSNIKHNIIIAEGDTLADFELALKEFFEEHMSKQL